MRTSQITVIVVTFRYGFSMKINISRTGKGRVGGVGGVGRPPSPFLFFPFFLAGGGANLYFSYITCKGRDQCKKNLF